MLHFINSLLLLLFLPLQEVPNPDEFEKSLDFLLEIAKKKDSLFFNKYDSISLIYPTKTHKKKLYSLKGSYYLYVDIKIDSSYSNLNRSLAISLEEKDSASIYKTRFKLSHLYSNIGDFKEAEEQILDALKHQETAAIHCELGHLYFQKNNFKKSIKEYKTAIKLANEKDQKFLYTANLIGAYHQDHDSINAFKFIQKLKGSEKKHLNTIHSYYVQFDRKNISKEALLNSLEEHKKVYKNKASNSLNLFNSYHILVEYLEKEKDSLLAFHYLKNEMLPLSLKNNQEEYKASILRKLSHYNVKYAKSYFSLKDRLNLKNQAFKNSYEITKYNFKKKEMDLLQATSLSKTQKITIYKLLISTLILTLSIIIVLSYFRWRNKKAKIAALHLKAKHQTELSDKTMDTEHRLSKKVHDEIANDLFICMNNFILLDLEEKYIDDIESIYNRSRNLSREMNNFDLVDFKNSLSNLVSEYNTPNFNGMIRNIENEQWLKIPKAIKANIYRVIQELLTNTSKHSKAELTYIKIEIKDNNLSIQYKDNGIGMDLKTVKSKNGLHNVENRIKNINGTLKFTSNNNKGFHADINIPINEV